jgi:hypothetical protein
MTAAVAEQADISIPAAVTIDVSDVNGVSAKPNQVVTVSQIVLASATKQLRLSIQANAATFSAPAGAPTTWAASDVSWSTTQNRTNATATDGTLSNTAYNIVATCNADVSSCSTNRLKFTLAANANIRRSGTYTIGITWKIESIGT